MKNTSQTVKIKEIWKDIPEYKGEYQASSIGRVRSIDRYVSGRGDTKRFVKGKVLSPGVKWNGYEHVSLSNGKDCNVHRLIAITFITNPKRKPCVNHKDGNKRNNKTSNLEWVTHSENEFHSINILEKVKKVFQYNLNGKYITTFPSALAAMRCTGIDNSGISKCLRGQKETTGGFLWKSH